MNAAICIKAHGQAVEWKSAGMIKELINGKVRNSPFTIKSS